jgi:HEAT repeats
MVRRDVPRRHHVDLIPEARSVLGKDFESLASQLAKGSRGKRAAAAGRLAVADDDRVDEVLLRALRDKSRIVRTSAVSALIKRDPGRPPEPIVNALRAHKGTSRGRYMPPDAREILELGLVRLESVSPVETLISDGLRSETAWIRMLAARSLGSAGDRRAVMPLLELLHDEVESVRRATITALGELRDRRALAALREAAARERFALRRRASAATRKIERHSG